MSASQGRPLWYWGPGADLLFGCGVWYVLAFAVLCVAGDDVRAAGGLAALPYLTLVFGTPHYGATLLRVYRKAEDRRAYALFAVHATIVIFALFAIGVHQPWVGSAILTLYLTWSPWHYSGQNYGITMMLLRRRDAAPGPRLKRILYLSFFLSFLLTFLAQHGGGQSDFAPLSYAGAGYTFLAIGLPDPFTGWAIAAVGSAYLLAVIAAVGGLVRASGVRACVPALVLMFSQALWFSIPLAARHWGVAQQFDPLSRDYADYYFLWIAVAHSIQYLWVTSFYARSQGDRSGLPRYLLRTLLAGAVIWVVPALIFAPDVAGRLPFGAGLGILVAATVNIHHFVLDGAIWKLRDGRVARVLLRPRGEPEPEPIVAERRRWPAWLVWGAGAACTVLLFYGKVESGFTERALAAGDVTRSSASLGRLSRVGMASDAGHLALADLLAASGNDARAEHEYTRSLELRPSALAWRGLAGIHARRGAWREAADAYEQAVALAPEQDVLHYESAQVLIELGELEAARAALQRAAELRPDRGINRRTLERVEASLARQR